MSGVLLYKPGIVTEFPIEKMKFFIPSIPSSYKKFGKEDWMNKLSTFDIAIGKVLFLLIGKIM